MHTISFYTNALEPSKYLAACVVVYTIKAVEVVRLPSVSDGSYDADVYVVLLTCAENGHGWRVQRACSNYADAASFVSWVRERIELAKGGDGSFERYE